MKEVKANQLNHIESIQDLTQSYFENHEFKKFANSMGRLSIFKDPDSVKIYEKETEIYSKKVQEILEKGKELI